MNSKSDLLKFLISKWYILLILSCIHLTIRSHYSVISLNVWFYALIMLQLPFEYLEKKLQDPDLRKTVKKKERVIAVSLLIIIILGLSAEYIWPKNTWVLIFRLLGVAEIVAWSLSIKDTV